MTNDQPGLLAYQDYPDEPVIIENLPVAFMRHGCFVPLSLTDGKLTLCMADPDDFQTLEAIRITFQLDVSAVPGRAEDIQDAIERLYGAGTQSIEHIIEEASRDLLEVSAGADADVDQLRDLASEAPIIRLVNRLILSAVDVNASDIHFEPFETVFKVRYRIDGVLNEVESPPKRFQAAIISRIKIMAKLDIAERRLPQDGRIKLKIADKEIDFRVSTIPTLYGESLVMRILDRGNLILELEQLGFPAHIYDAYERLARQPYGMILVTGPTGSGKTSTLYTTLSKINSPEKKIMTLEDPVEYQLHGVNQIQVNTKIGMTFASGLRSIVRQDPDIILVGEIRDRETAEIAIQSALTGHLLFSTLHTNDAPGAVTRLLDMGVAHFLLSSTLLGVLAQRLVRVNCPECITAYRPEDKHLLAMGIDPDEMDDPVFYRGAGCELCRHTGYKGRQAIFEYLPISTAIRKLIHGKATADQIRAQAMADGMLTLRQDGWLKVRAGITTIPEVLRVTLET